MREEKLGLMVRGVYAESVSSLANSTILNIRESVVVADAAEVRVFFLLLFLDLFTSGEGFPLYPEFFLHYYTMILQRIRIVVGDAGFEPGPLPQKSGALPMSHYISFLILL